MTLEALVSYPSYIYCYLSYKRKNYEASYKLIILLHIRAMLGFLNPGGDEVGINKSGRLAVKWIAQLTNVNYNIFLACQIYTKNY